MFKATSYFRELCLRATRALGLGILGLLLVFIFSGVLSGNNKVSALTSGTINYQARLLQSNGAIVPDGNYNVDFKLYSTASSGGGQAVGTCTSAGSYTCLWEENYTGGNTVQVKDGYLTVNLGSITAFPSTINWANQLYLTMNIGGTSVSPTWDGEMSPRIQLTSVPYAFQANSAVTATTLSLSSGSYTDILQLSTPSANNTITVPDATGTVCLQSSSSCGFATGSGSAILQNGNSFGAAVTIGSTTAYGVNLITNNAIVEGLSSTGAAYFENSTNSTAAFKVENSSAASILAVDTTNNQVVLGNQTANAGNLVFDDGANSNTIQLSASSATAAYSLTLPLSSPTSNLCLESGSVSTPGQLQFTSCYNTTPTISAVVGGSWSGTATSGTTVTGGTLSSVAPVNSGDLLVVTTSLPTTAGTVTSISGGGVTTWTLAKANAAVGSALRVETWFGTVTSTGTHALTLTHSGTLTSGTAEVDVTEFTAAGVTSSSSWGIDTSGVASSATNTSTLSMANLSPSQSGELYYGFANDQSSGLGTGGSCPNVPSAGTTWTCTTSAGGQSNVVDYDLSATSGTVGGYNGKVLLGSTSKNYNSVAILFNAYISSTAINNSVSTQFGNFNVQAPDTVSVAGVLEAGVGSSQDILDIRNSSGVNVDTFGSTGNVVFAPSTVSTTAFQVENSSAVPIVTVDTSNDKLILNSTVSDTSGLEFSQLNSASAASSNFSQLLGVDSSGNVGLSTAGVALTSPALAYWDGLNDPTVTGQSYPLATITGSHTSYSSGNGEQLTDTSTTNESGSINWNFSQVPFEEIQFQFKAGGGTGADSTWFYGYADATPTTEFGTGMSQGYIIYFSEYHGCIGIAWVGYTDGNQCGSGGGANPLASVAESNIGNDAWHNVDIEINYNVITVRWDGVIVLTYTDVYTRNTSDLNFGFGSRTGSETNDHYIKGLVVTKLGSVAGDFGIDSVSPIIGNLNWDTTNSSLGIDTAAPTANLDVAGTALFTGSTSTTDFQVQNASSVNLLTVDTSNNQVVVGAGNAGDSTGYLLILDSKTTTGDPAEVDGAMYYNTYTDNFRCGVSGTWQNCAGGLASNTSAVAVHTCTTACAAFNANATLGANYCEPGEVITININGVWGSSSATPTISLGVYFGTSATRTSDTLIGIASPTFGAAATAEPWSMTYQINCFTSGTSGTIMGGGYVDWGTSSSAFTREWMQPTSTTTMKTTVAQNIYIFPIWSASSASNTITANTIAISSN